MNPLSLRVFLWSGGGQEWSGVRVGPLTTKCKGPPLSFCSKMTKNTHWSGWSGVPRGID